MGQFKELVWFQRWSNLYLSIDQSLYLTLCISLSLSLSLLSSSSEDEKLDPKYKKITKKEIVQFKSLQEKRKNLEQKETFLFTEKIEAEIFTVK